MNKTQLIDEIKQTVSDLTKPEIDKVIIAITSVISKTLKDGDNITLVGFGTFSAVKRAARIGRNPKTGEEIKIAEMTAPKFKAGKHLKEEVSGKKAPTKQTPAKATAKALVKAPIKAPTIAKPTVAKKVAKKK